MEWGQCNLLRGKIIGSYRKNRILNLPCFIPQTLSKVVAQQVCMETSLGSFRVEGLDLAAFPALSPLAARRGER